MEKELEEKIRSLFSREELRRLEKAAKDKNKKKLSEWAKQFEEQIDFQYQIKFKEELKEFIDILILVVVYTLHFNESTKFGGKRIDSFMKDLFETIDMFRRGEAVPDDYREQLKKDGITVKGVDK